MYKILEVQFTSFCLKSNNLLQFAAWQRNSLGLIEKIGQIIVWPNSAVDYTNRSARDKYYAPNNTFVLFLRTISVIPASHFSL
jgi:hypothetical protein